MTRRPRRNHDETSTEANEMLEVEMWRERSEIEIEIEIEIHDMLEVELWSCRVPFTQIHRSVHPEASVCSHRGIGGGRLQ